MPRDRILKALLYPQGGGLAGQLGAISEAFNGSDWELWGAFGGMAAWADQLRRERDEARADLAAWEAMTPNRLRLRADMLEAQSEPVTVTVEEGE